MDFFFPLLEGRSEGLLFLLIFDEMTSAQAQKRIQELTEQINEHNYRYYVLDRPTISDYEYDLLMKELIDLERQFPEFLSPNSPSQRVGGQITKEFKTVKHKYPMLSLGNTYSKEELVDFDNRIKKAIGDDYEYVCELKYDGIGISLIYLQGELSQAITRGDGTWGDDVTTNVKTIKSIPFKLKGDDYPAEFIIRGEIFMRHKTFALLNKERNERGEPLFANPRNATSGTIKLQDSKEVAKRNLDCYLYFLLGENLLSDEHYENLKKAEQWGFKISPHKRKCKNLDEVLSFIEYWGVERNNLDYDIDGVVIKINSLRKQEMLGSTAKSPRWAISYKYQPDRVRTVLKSISYQVGRTGAITPVANLEPVLLAGTTVKRASLHNADIIKELDVRIGDTVFVEKGGEIIPKIASVDLEKRPPDAEPTKFIENCPECKTLLIRKQGESIHYCPNEEGCPPQIKGRIFHFVTRDAMNIEQIGEETIELLYKHGLVRNIADLYDLKKEQLIPLERMGEKSAMNIIQGIENSKQVPFNRVLYALGIRYVGKTVANKLANHFKNIDNLIKADVLTLMEVEEIGETIAKSVVNYFNNPKNRELIERLKSKGLQFELSSDVIHKISDKLQGKLFVVSGIFKNFSREGIKQTIEQNGGRNASSVSSKTDYLVAGEKPGPEKIAKAKKLGIKIITEEEFMEML